VWLCLVRRLPLAELVAHVPRLSRAGLLSRGPLVGLLRERLRSAAEQKPPPLGPLETYALKRHLEASRPKQHHRPASSQQLDDVIAALHEHSFKAVPATGKRFLVAVDVRGPMAHGRVRGLDGVTPAEASALLLQALVRTGDAVTALAFAARGLVQLEVDARMSLADISRRMRETPMGPVDVSLPLRWAKEQGRSFDLVLVCTDNQTQSFAVHPAQALREYREACSLPGTRFAVCAMCSQGFSLAPPDELGMLDRSVLRAPCLKLILNKAAIRAWFLMPLGQHVERHPAWQAHPQPFLEVRFWVCLPLYPHIQSDAQSTDCVLRRKHIHYVYSVSSSLTHPFCLHSA
ncbi:hypothetical protein V5799_033282, partial [Amblyomma americanum]